MKEYKYTINGNKYEVAIGEIVDNIATVTVNGEEYKVEMEKEAEPEKKKVVEEVGQNAKAIRGLLGNRIRHQMRVVPELRFIEDDSLDYIENIDNLLHPEK